MRDQSSLIESNTQAVTGVVNTAERVYEKVENDEINLISSTAQQEYANWKASADVQAKNDQRNPGVVYKEYDELERVEFERIQKSYENASWTSEA